MTIRSIIVAIFAVAMAIVFGVGTAGAELTAKANHDHITVDFMYHGSTVGVRGISDPDVDLVIKIASENIEQELNMKGKIGGLIWMNTGHIKFEEVPNFYILQSTKKLEEIISDDEAVRNGIGFAALKKNSKITISKPDDGQKDWFEEFVRLKESSHLYKATVGQITFSQVDGKNQYHVQNQWPFEAPAGGYDVTVYAIKNGKVVETAISKVSVEQVGGVRYLTNMAKNNAALYGAISIISAILAGFGVGLIFKKGGGAH